MLKDIRPIRSFLEKIGLVTTEPLIQYANYIIKRDQDPAPKRTLTKRKAVRNVGYQKDSLEPDKPDNET
jgi:hypothetical protein